MFKMGLENLLEDSNLIDQLKGKRVAYLGHPSSTNRTMVHGIDLLKKEKEVNLTAGFGPQHGMKGDLQDNMVETEDDFDSELNIPIFSLYGAVRRPTEKMLESFDLLLFDLQDVGCRIYTYLTTLIYLMEDLGKAGKTIWVLDRPNPAGRPIEGYYLDEAFKSFVGAVRVPMRHGLTLGEVALWYQEEMVGEVDLKVIPMKGYYPENLPGCGWPDGQFSWVNPSPNLSNYYSCRSFPGTVLFEGTLLSEGRGTTRALEQVGAPGLNSKSVIRCMEEMSSSWMKGALIRPCFFQPTFQKQSGKLCEGLFIHVDDQREYRA